MGVNNVPIFCTTIHYSHHLQCTEVRFVSFLSGGFMPAIVVNPPERKLAKRTFLHWVESIHIQLSHGAGR